MHRNNRCRNVAKVMCLAIGVAFGQAAKAQSRITESVQGTEHIAVQGSTPNRLISVSRDIGRLSSSQSLGRMVLLLAPTTTQDQAAADLIASQHDASSPLFHKWLTPAEVGQQFGIADADSSQVSDWLQSQG